MNVDIDKVGGFYQRTTWYLTHVHEFVVKMNSELARSMSKRVGLRKRLTTWRKRSKGFKNSQSTHCLTTSCSGSLSFSLLSVISCSVSCLFLSCS